jgi:outer membrane usher protein
MPERKTTAVPCLTRGQLASMGVNTAALPDRCAAADACVPLTEMIKDITIRFDVANSACT